MSEIDEKWKKVKDHYERAYRIRFKAQPAPNIVDDLHRKMFQLSRSLENHREQNPQLAYRLEVYVEK